MMPGARTHPFAQREDFHIQKAGSMLRRSRLFYRPCAYCANGWVIGVVIVGKVMGPWSLSYQLMGMKSFWSAPCRTRARPTLA